MKICVYAICKNEEKHVNRWVESMKEADEIYVLDTGSTDQTKEKLENLGVKVTRKLISPWRFDNARNESLKLVPLDTDICVCTDLDEVFEPGWRKSLEEQWTPNTTKARYNYNWSLDQNNNPKVNFYIEKIHTPHNYKWTHPVHEVLEFTGEIEKTITLNNITLNHYPDSTKSRSSYLPLLELSIQENPEDDRNMHYLGREYMYYGKWTEAITTLKKHLDLKTATWKDERSASLRFISRCYKNLDNYAEARLYLDKAHKEAPHLRDPLVERAILEFEQKNYIETEKYCLKALQIKSHEKTYINEPFSWDHTIYDLLAVSCYYQNKLDYAIYFNNLAIDLAPTNKRLLNNHEIYKKQEQINSLLL
ncbi:MAG: glycosyltransferase [Bacilli bacterium]|nr:glycosyltransferase [Bacilli bacterium]